MKYSFSFLLAFLSLNLYAHYGTVIPAEKLYVSTDRYYYEPSDQVYYSVFLCSDSTMVHHTTKAVKVWLINPAGNALDSGIYYFNNGKASNAFTLPSTGGAYKLRAVSVQQLNQLHPNFFEKELFVQSYYKKNFHIVAEKDKNNYTRGNQIQLDLSFRTAGNMKLNKLPYKAYLVQSGMVIASKTGETDDEGKGSIGLLIPTDATEDPIFINVETNYQGELQSMSELVPMSLKKAQLSVFYESGLQGYIPGVVNTLIIRSTDDRGNSMDIAGELLDGNGKLISAFSTVHKGMCAITFTPASGKTYQIKGRSGEMIMLNKSAVFTGIKTTRAKTGNVRIELAQEADRDMLMVISGKGQLLHKLRITKGSKPEPMFITRLNGSGVYGIWLFDPLSMEVLASKTIFMGKEQLVFADLEINDELIWRQNAALKVKHPEGRSASFSLSVVKESNYRQMKDHNHSIVSWNLLGYEFQTEIEDPQYYFDTEEPEASAHLDLLMNTLSGVWQRDPLNGKVKANPNADFDLGPIAISGIVNSNISGVVKNAKVRVKNTSVEAVTDENGRFTLLVPRHLGNQLTLQISKGGEKMEQEINNIYAYQGETTFISKRKEIDPEPDPVEKGILALEEIRNGNLGDIQANFAVLKKPMIEEEVNAPEADRALYMRADAPDFEFAQTGVAQMVIMDAPMYRWNFQEQVSWNYSEPFYINLDPPKNRQEIFKENATDYNATTAIWLGFVQTGANQEFSYNIPTGQLQDGYRILVEGLDDSGRPFYGEKFVRVIKPIDFQVNIPQAITCGDELQIPVKIVNNTHDPISFKLEATGDQAAVNHLIHPKQHLILYKVLKAPESEGKMNYSIHFSSPVENKQWSQQITCSQFSIGMNADISSNKASWGELDLTHADMSTLKVSFELHPNFSDDLLEVSKNMLRMPSGCFEQVSSSNYPNVAILLLQQRSAAVDHEFYSRAKSLIDAGYGKMIKYETSTGGFEWFGKADGHVGLTAYGLLQFFLMKEIGFKIDDRMFNRVKEWISQRRDGNGGFAHSFGLDNFGRGTKDACDAYTTWVLSRIGVIDLEKELSRMENKVAKEYDAYDGVLLANIYKNLGREAGFRHHYKAIKEHIEKNNFKDLQAAFSVVGSRGISLDAEILALALIASRDMESSTFIEQLMSKLLELKSSSGMIGNTQSTALAYEALAYHLKPAMNSETIDYTILINGRESKFQYSKNRPTLSTMEINKDFLKQGKNRIEILVNDNAVPYSVVFNWKELRKDITHPELAMEVKYQNEVVQAGASSVLTLKVSNLTNEYKGQLVAELFLPAGVSLPSEQFRTLMKTGAIDYYEIDGNRLNLYFLSTNPLQVRELYLSYKAEIPGIYRSKASRVFEYYMPEVEVQQVMPNILIKS